MHPRRVTWLTHAIPAVPTARRVRVGGGRSDGMLAGGRRVSPYACGPVHPDDQDAKTADEVRNAWNAWHPNVPLTVLSSRTRSLTRPIVDHLRAVHAETEDDRFPVLIPEMQLPHVWLRLLRNQHGPVLDRAIRRCTTR